MIHGDLDFYPTQQAEESLTALERQGKRARFVRYWAEGHVIHAGANVADMMESARFVAACSRAYRPADRAIDCR